MRMLPFILVGITGFSLLTVTGCAPREAAQSDVAQMSERADSVLQSVQPQKQVVSSLVEEETPWFGNRAIPAQTGDLLPQSFEQDKALVLTFERPLTLEEVAARIQAATNLRVSLDKPPESASSGGTGASTVTVDRSITFVPADGLEVTGGRMVWQGKLSNLLDQIADKFDLSWHFENQTITLSQQMVRTFMLHALAGSTDVGGSVKTGSGSGATDTGLPQQSVDTTSKLALWDEIQKAIDTIVVGKARASYSPATGTITVAGYPSAVNSVEQYLRLQNRLRLRRVALEAQVLSVQLSKEYNNNFDIDVVVREAFNNQPFVFSSQGAADGRRNVTAGLLRQIPASLGTRGTTQLVVNALSAVAENIAVEYSGTLVTLSDQPAPLQVATKRAYVARVSGSATDGAASTTLEPGTIDIGLSMNLLPRVIEQDRIMLRIALGITDLVQLREFSSGGSSVQLPEVDSTGFLQNAVLHTGETLVLAGFERKNANNNARGTGHEKNWLLGGGAAYGQGREIRVLMITANVLPEEPVDVIRP